MAPTAAGLRRRRPMRPTEKWVTEVTKFSVAGQKLNFVAEHVRDSKMDYTGVLFDPYPLKRDEGTGPSKAAERCEQATCTDST